MERDRYRYQKIAPSVMIVLLSPAKSLNLNRTFPKEQATIPRFFEDARAINAVLRKKSVRDLSALMDISEKLARLNWERNQAFAPSTTVENGYASGYIFDGDVYDGLDVESLPQHAIASLQNRVRILSGLYGLLKPLDLIQPYRLEMGTSLAIKRHKNLYAYWQPKITKALVEETAKDTVVLNLASKEYASAVNFKVLGRTVVAPQFKEFRSDKLTMISFFAKKARGMMARYVLESNAKTLEDIRGFNFEGYTFSETETTKENEPVFVR